MKLTSLHTLTHTDDKEDAIYCAICENAIIHNLTPSITTDLKDFEFKNIKYFIQKEISINYKSILSNSAIPRELFSRPPPFLV